MLLRRPTFLSVMFLIGPVASGCVAGGRASYQAMVRDYETIDTRARQSRAQDERVFSAAELDRRAVVRAVLDRNPNLESARQAWRAALARYRQAGTYDDPRVKFALAPLSIASANTHFGYEVGISQRIPIGGELDARAMFAAAEAEAVSGNFKEMRLKLALATSQLYDDYFVAVRSLEIQARHLVLIDAMKRSAVEAYESGRAAAQDSLQAEAERARLEYQQTVYETERDVAVAQLNALLHRAPDAPLPPPPQELRRRDRVGGESDASVPSARTLERRPDIAVARARVRAAEARSAVVRSEYYPELMLETSYSSMWDMPEHRWMAGVQLSIPVERGRRRAATDEASAMRAASQSELTSMTDAARGEIAVALRKLAQARRAVELYEQRLVPVARDQIEAARAGFVTAQTTFVAVIEAERGLRAAELELEMVRADLSRRTAELDRALGRMPGMDGDEAVP